MTTPLDRDLAERLERLAAAVPVRPGRLDPVHASAVAARRRVRLSWLTPLVALLLLALLAAIIGVGSLKSVVGPISTTTRLGEFTLTLTSAKSRYRTGEPVVIDAELTFEGAAEESRIAHAGDSPLGFGIKEPVHGFLLEPVSRQSCRQGWLNRGIPVQRSFAKSGGYGGVNEDEFERFMTDPTLVLSAGTWHPYVVAEFRLGGCDGDTI